MSVVAQPFPQAEHSEHAELAVGPAAMSRRHAAGSSSARGVLFTILGEFVLPADGQVWTSTVIETMGRLGIEEKATRQALMRTAADGWLTAERLGRRTRWRLTTAADRLLTEGTERIYGFGAHRGGWDGSWLLVLARATEADRPARHVLRSRLTWAGFGSPAPGIWISTHADRLGEVAGILAEAGLADEAQVFRGTHEGGQLATMVAQAWDLGAITQRYDDFLAAFADPRPADPLAATIELLHTWRRFPWTDPDLPRQLLPRPWSGARAAALFRRRHAQWSPGAVTAWQHLAAQDSGSGR
jgi:phenylacetic acid degradation operon negative regulatory protein